MKKLFNICLLLLMSISTNSYSQIWMNGFDKNDSSPNKRYNFYEIQNDFQKYWFGKNINRKTPKSERGGWMQYKRWEWFWEQRVFPTGEFPNPMHTYNELTKLQNKKVKDLDVKQSSNWENIGPESSTGGYGGLGRLNCIIEDPDYNGTTNKTIWVGSASGGLWKTTDDGASWSSSTDKLPTLGVSSICINPSSKNIMYIATGDGDHSDTYSVGVLKSTDGGENWNTTGLNWTIQQNRLVRRLIMHPTDSDILYAATSQGVYKTTNGGSSWSLLSIAFTNAYEGVWDIEFKPGSPQVIYATSTWEIARSTNGGENWTVLSGGLPNYGDNTYRVEIAVTPNDANYIYALYGYMNYGGGNSNNNSGLYGVYRSSNSGTSWTEVLNWDDNNLNLLGWSAIGNDTGGQAWYDLALAVSPSNKNYVFVGGVNVWRSTDGGSDWDCVAHWYGQDNVPTVHADHHHLHFSGNTDRLYAGHDGGINRTTNNGTSWSWIGSGLKITQFYRMGVSQTNSDITIGGSQDNGTKLKISNNWYDVIGGDGMECIIDYTDSDYMWGALYYGEILRTTNGGNSWASISKPNENGAWVTPYILHPTNPQIMYAGYKNVWRSTNRGTSWNAISNFSSGQLTLLHIAPSNPNYIFAGYGSTLNKTTNGGTDWTNVTLPAGNTLTYMAIHPDNPNRIWAVFSGYSNGQKVFYSTNGGSNWTNLSGDLPNIPVNTIVYQTNMDNRIYIGTDLGVFYRDDNSNGWIQFNNGLPNVVVNELEIQTEDNLLFAATFGRGIWSVTLPGAYIALTAPVQNYPSNNATNIKIDTLLNWSSVQTAENYQLQISINSDYSSTLVNLTQTGLTYLLSNFNCQYSTTYYWRVRAKRGDEYGPWSSRYFTTEPIPLVAPTLTNPNDNATNIHLSSNLTWNSVQGADNYNLQISLNLDFANILSDVTQSGLSYSLSGINPQYSTKYYWRVRAKRGDNEFSNWSSRNFMTELIPLVAPTLTNPNDLASNVPINVNLTWNSVQGAENYIIQLSKNSDFSVIISNITQAGLSYSLSSSNPEYSTTYYWRVRAKRGDEEGPLSTRSFTTEKIPLIAPVLNNPNNNSTNISITENLSWSSVQGANGYQLQVSVNTDFTNNIIDVNQNTLSYSLSNADIEYSTKYYWRVRAKRDDENGPWANIRNFTTEQLPLLAPQLNEPAHFASNIQLNSDLSWFEVESADSYQLQISLSSTFFVLTTDEIINDLEYSLTNSTLSYSTNYYWRVRSKRGEESSSWSTTRRFTTQAIPLVAPNLTNPNDNATNIELNSNLSWSSVTGANRYQIQLSINSSFDNNIVDLTYNGLTYSLANATIDYSTKYYWRVRAKRNDEEGPWANYRSFTTIPIPLVAPVLVSPTNNSTKIAINSNLNWNQVQGADNYDLQISLNSNFNNLIKDVTISELTFSLLNADIDYSTKYYWRVRARRNEESGPWANAFNFTTRSEFLPPVQQYPPNLAENILNSEKLSWTIVEDADFYHIQLSYNENFSSFILDDNELIGNELSLSSLNLNINQEVFWRIRSINDFEQSIWSNIRKFKTYPKTSYCDSKANISQFYISEISLADLVYESTSNWGYSNYYDTYNSSVHKKSVYQFSAIVANSSSSTNCKLWIDWNNDNDFDDNDESIALNGSPGTGPFSANITIPNNVVNNAIRARIITSSEAINSSCGIINDGEVEDFRINVLPALVVPPELISPLNNAKDIPLQADLIWDVVENASNYILQISETSDFNSIYYEVSTSNTIYQIPNNILQYRKIYFWRVKSVGNYNTSDYSVVRKFDTKLSVPDSWDFQSGTGLSSIIKVPHTINPKLGNRDIQNGDAIGLFFNNNGTEVCAGYGVWNGTTIDITVWGDDQNTIEKDGYTAGEEYKFKLWDSQLDLVYPAIATYQSGPDEFTNNAISILSLLESTIRYQLINLSMGWNMISSYIQPIQPSMTDVWNSINDDVTIVKNGLGNNYLPQFDINSIGDWNLYEGYQVYMTNPATLTIGGIESVPQNEEINLPIGWSMISYLRNSSMNIETALATLTNNNALVLAKDNNGNSYLPAFDINSIGNMTPGSGYQVFLINPETLIYPMNNQPKTTYMDTEITPIIGDVLLPEITNTGDNMTIIVELDRENSGLDIGVYNNDNLLVGSGRIIGNKAFITVWNDSDDDENASNLTLRTYDKIAEQFCEMTIQSIQNYLNGEILKDVKYKSDAVLYIVAQAIFEINTTSISVSPNPISERCEVAVFLNEQADMTLTLYNTNGVEVYSNESGNILPGRYSYVIQSGEFAVGDYILVLKYNDKSITKKLILMR